MAQDMSQRTPRSPRWVKLLLGLSLAVNLAVAGMVAGAVLRGGPKGAPPAAGSFAAPYVRALPREDRRAIFMDMRNARVGGGREARRASYQQMLAALRAEVFDMAAVAAVLDQQQGMSLTVQEATQSRWLTLVSEMSLEERRAYADAVEEAMQRKPRKKRDR